VDELARDVNSFDALLGVHGAGLTNTVFLPAGAVVIQVVSSGNLERMSRTDFGEPVADMGLAYLEYSVAAEESTLLDMLVSSEATRGRPSSTFRPPPRAPSRPPPPCR
jgi:capsular polysaccharide biosynthesis protein